MSEMLRSRHAFGSRSNLLAAIENGLIDAYDIIFLKEGEICWLDGQGNLVEHDTKKIEFVDALPEVGEREVAYVCNSKFYFWNGTEFVASATDCGVTEDVVNEMVNSAKQEVFESANQYTDIKVEETEGKIEAASVSAIQTANVYTDEKLEIAEKIKYEITSKPIGTLVNYSENEIRVMCPDNTVWTKQNVGATGDSDKYYMAFKAYAPEDAVSFKEGDRGVIVDEMFTFDSEFAGIDEHGRKYSICWLALASYDSSTDTWNYYGKNSTSEKYLGWDYVVEWYNSDGVMIASDGIRINLSNANCHISSEPYYVSNAVKTAKEYTDEKIAEAVAIVEF